MAKKIILVLLLVLIGASKVEAQTSADLEVVHEKEKKLFELLDSPSQSQSMKQLDEVRKQELKLFHLAVGEKSYPAASAYIATKLINKYECRLLYADDTSHVTEGEAYTAIPWHSGDTLKVQSAWAPSQIEQLDFFTGAPSEMQANGYKNVVKLAYDANTGVLEYKPRDLRQHQLLFAIVKAKGDKLYRKFVFVIDKPQSGK